MGLSPEKQAKMNGSWRRSGSSPADSRQSRSPPNARLADGSRLNDARSADPSRSPSPRSSANPSPTTSPANPASPSATASANASANASLANTWGPSVPNGGASPSHQPGAERRYHVVRTASGGLQPITPQPDDGQRLTSPPAPGQVIFLSEGLTGTSVFWAGYDAGHYGNGRVAGHPLIVLEVHGEEVICAQVTSFSGGFESKWRCHDWGKRYHPIDDAEHRHQPERIWLGRGQLRVPSYANGETPLVVEWANCRPGDRRSPNFAQPRLERSSFDFLHDRLRHPLRYQTHGNYDPDLLPRWLEKERPTYLASRGRYESVEELRAMTAAQEAWSELLAMGDRMVEEEPWLGRYDSPQDTAEESEGQ